MAPPAGPLTIVDPTALAALKALAATIPNRAGDGLVLLCWIDGEGRMGLGPGPDAGATTPDASAQLDMQSTTGGLLVPRLTTAERNAIAAPATSLLLYNRTTRQYETWDGSAWIPLMSALNLGAWGLLGDGNDGDVVVAPGDTLILSRDLLARSITLGAGSTIKTQNYRVFCQGLITGDPNTYGRFVVDADNGHSGVSGGAPGVPTASGTLAGSIVGGTGSTGIGGAAGGGLVVTTLVPCLSGNGGDGGAGGAGIGGPGALAQIDPTNGTGRCLQDLIYLNQIGVAYGGSNPVLWGGPAGGGGGGDGVHRGGGGASGGGTLQVYCLGIRGRVHFDLRGGRGGDGDPAGNTGGGGGGAGGGLWIVTSAAGLIEPTVTYDLTGGLGGAAGGTGQAGVAGGSGQLVLL